MDFPKEGTRNPARPVSKILKAGDVTALDYARQGIDEAQAKANHLIQEAEAQRDQILAQAQEQAKAQSAAMVSEYLARMQHDLARREAGIIDIVMESVRKLVLPAPKPDLIAALARRAMKDIDTGSNARLTVAPQNVQGVRQRLTQAGFSEDVITVQGNPDCAEDGSTLHCDFGDIELSLVIQLAALEQGLRVALGHEAE